MSTPVATDSIIALVAVTEDCAPVSPPVVASRPLAKRRRRRRRLTIAVRDRAVGLIARLAVRVFSHTSPVTTARLARAAGTVTYHLARKERAQALSNLARAYAGGLRPRERRALARAAFQSVAMTVAEAVAALRWREDDLRDRVRVDGIDHCRAALARGQGVVFVAAHLGSWELVPLALRHHLDLAVAAVARDIRNPWLHEAVRDVRARLGVRVYSRDGRELGYLRTLTRGGGVILMADQDTRHVRCTRVHFFGQVARAPLGPAHLARRTGAALVPIFLARAADSATGFVLRCHRPVLADLSLDEDADLCRMLQAVTDVLEAEIRRAPGQWVWMHRRWRA
ncbi:MAG: lysophospholipid acyltransferase family protein [Candidatus Rokubacteria bacterium]|nr:lysophospholipid acyltransferase family protein [Candidatus Rokubacteria bacterium]